MTKTVKTVLGRIGLILVLFKQLPRSKGGITLILIMCLLELVFAIGNDGMSNMFFSYKHK